MEIEYQNTVIQAIYNSEGRSYFTGSTTRYEYTIIDHTSATLSNHLGNARISFTDQNVDGTPEIIQENHYYPFGLAMEGPWVNDPAEDNKYQYNGKELNDDFGLGWMDYGARWYDASVGRWNGVDPLAEKMPSWSPFSYAFNNPLKFVDPTGMEPGLTPDPGDKDSKRDRRIRREIKKARDQALSEGREISAMEAQNIIAVENQNKRWYRHGAVRDNKAWFASKTTGGRVQTILIWQLYQNIDKLAYESKADATEESQPYNVATEVNIDPNGEFVEGSMNGDVLLTMDDLGVPDNLIVTYQTANGPETIKTGFGNKDDHSDNLRTLKIPHAELKSTVLTVTVSNPNGRDNGNAYDLTVRTTGTAERKSSKSVHAIIDRRPTRRRR